MLIIIYFIFRLPLAFCPDVITIRDCPKGLASTQDGRCVSKSELNLKCSPGDFITQNGHCKQCPSGHYCPSPLTDPVACPKGTYQPREGNSTGCAICANGYYSDGSSPCKICPKGAYCLFNDTGSFYINCPQGTFQPDQGKTVADACKPCPKGNYNNFEGSTYCYDCPKGHFCINGTVKPCPIGTYQYDLNSTKCEPCWKGYASGIGYELCVSCKNWDCDPTILPGCEITSIIKMLFMSIIGGAVLGIFMACVCSSDSKYVRSEVSYETGYDGETIKTKTKYYEYDPEKERLYFKSNWVCYLIAFTILAISFLANYINVTCPKIGWRY